jgi:hypothetical protein
MPRDVTPGPHDRLIASLTADLRPVQRLQAPIIRAFIWVALVVAIGLALAAFANLPAMWHRISDSPDMWLAVLGSIGTAVLAAIAAFELSLPDRSRRWALLPLPTLVLWIAASGAGCLRTTLLGGTHVANMGEARDCLVFIVGFSIPLSVVLFMMLRRAYPLRPTLTATLAGLAAAAAAATLLNFFHPYDAAALDLVVHAVAVTLVVMVTRGFSRLTVTFSGAA